MNFEKRKRLRAMAKFNQKERKETGCQYVPPFRGRFLYLGRKDSDRVDPSAGWNMPEKERADILPSANTAEMAMTPKIGTSRETRMWTGRWPARWKQACGLTPT